jgi:predicted nucleic acid-binding protein
MKVIFDSNVWQIITLPDDFPSETSLTDFRKIRQAIVDKRIEAFLSETIFTIEAIKKVERQDFFSNRKPKIEIVETDTEEGWTNLNISIKPEKGIDFNERPILKKYFCTNPLIDWTRI